MALQQWALPRLSKLLPLEQGELQQIIIYTDTLSARDASTHLTNLLGDSPQASEFVASFNEHRSGSEFGASKQANQSDNSTNKYMPPSYAPPSNGLQVDRSNAYKQADASASGVDTMFQPGSGSTGDTKQSGDSNNEQPPGYAPPSNTAPGRGANSTIHYNHTNAVIEAANLRAQDEQQIQNMLQSVQLRHGIYNSEIDPEHEADWCNCDIHQYKRAKWSRYKVQEIWSRAVMYPGERSYNDNQATGIFTSNPYKFRVISPYGFGPQTIWSAQRPVPQYHAQSIHETIALNNSLNLEAQSKIDAKEPQINIWGGNALASAISTMAIDDKKRPIEKASDEKQQSSSVTNESSRTKPRTSRLSSFRISLGIKSSEERAITKVEKATGKGDVLRNEILLEERGRWPNEQWRNIVATYQEKVGMTAKIADLRNRHPIQYLHLLRAGYFEPIPVAWATQVSNPLKFSIESSAGWRGITPNWRGYEDTAEERLYWVLNHRDGSAGTRMKPDFISEMNMARARMATAVEPPPEYFSANDTCHVQNTTAGYSKQVMPAPFRAYDRPEVPSDDTMILLDVSGSMDFDPVRPNYDQYLITGYITSRQPKNKDVAKAIIRRFTDAMSHHDHNFRGYDLATFSSQATYIGTISHQNFDATWQNVKLGGGTRVMTGWQKVKELHFKKHSESATHHPVYGWQAGPATPMLRLLLLLDGEATDMDEFELDLLGLSWAHVTIFLIGVDGCPHHHRHANELQRISDVNHHVAFVDAQGNTPERFVTHELLKRHLGYEISMQEFTQMEELPAYSVQ